MAPPARDQDSNEHGDRRETPAEVEEHPPLTFYQRDGAVGYKAVVATRQGKVDERQWRELVRWVKVGRLPDGAPLSRLRLIVPLREAAVAVADRAARDGLDAVLYVDDDGAWWNPAPAPARSR